MHWYTHTHLHTHTDPQQGHKYFTEYYRTHYLPRMFSRYYTIYCQCVPQGSGWQHMHTGVYKQQWQWSHSWAPWCNYIMENSLIYPIRLHTNGGVAMVLFKHITAWTCTHTHTSLTTHTAWMWAIKLRVPYPTVSCTAHMHTRPFTVSLWDSALWVPNCWGSMW